MTARLHTCGQVHECTARDPVTDDDRAVAVLVTMGWSKERARQTVLGWYDDEDRLGYDEGHVCCPDCGDEPDDHTLHRDGCPRVLPVGHPLEYLQFGPPWQPMPAGAR